jgi:hypothetical protein
MESRTMMILSFGLSGNKNGVGQLTNDLLHPLRQ